MKTYLVGGAVRDKLMGLEPKDRDWVVVGARGDDVERMLSEGYTQVGADFPVFLHPATGEEYALARVERKIGAGYHGFMVEADASVTIEDDLARRDLTINSMAMAEDGTVIDPYGGRKDLHNHVLRHTTAAFAEDPLRVLRLARFAARYKDFKVAPETIELCKEITRSGELEHLSKERVWTELAKGFSEENPVQMFEVMNATGALGGCHILQRTFGTQLNDWQRKRLRQVPLVCKDPETRFIVGIVAAAKRFGMGEPSYPDEIAKKLGRKERGDALQGAPARMLDLYKVMHELVDAQRNSTSFFSLLKHAGALREGPGFNDLVQLAVVFEMAGDALAFNARGLVVGREQLKSVKAAEFPHLKDKELGQAIESARMDRLQLAMDIPKGVALSQPSK